MDVQPAQQSPSYDGIPTLSVEELGPDILNHRIERKNTGAKGFSLLVAIGLNSLVLLLLAWWTIVSFTEEEIELVVESGPVESLTQIDKKQFQKKQQTKPTPAAGIPGTAIDYICRGRSYGSFCD